MREINCLDFNNQNVLLYKLFLQSFHIQRYSINSLQSYQLNGPYKFAIPPSALHNRLLALASESLENSEYFFGVSAQYWRETGASKCHNN